jgi:hypothetical protein
MNKTILTLTAVAALSSVARANLLDTQDDAKRRYGVPTSQTEFGATTYEKGGWRIEQDYNGRGWCWTVSYIRLDGDPITQEQADAMGTTNFGAPFAATTAEWTYERLENDVEGVRNREVWSAKRLGYRVVSGYRLLGSRWCAYRSVQNWNDANIPQTPAPVPQ